MQEPKIAVGIMFEPSIEFELMETYVFENNEVVGNQLVRYENKKIIWDDKEFDELLFVPKNEGLFELKEVTIGINFHWERKENQRFKGGLKIIIENEKLTAINLVSVEDYLISVISSEMSATASLELLKAHAVISRSWLLAQKLNTAPQPPKGGVKSAYPPFYARLKELALKNRHNPTEAESFLWENLKGRNLDGFKFRRQHIIDDCIVDFVCLSENLVVEVDGKYHNDPEIQEYDKLRTQLLNKHGFKVIRFTNDDVLFNIDDVLNSIKAELRYQTPPSGGRGASSLIWYERDAHTNFDVCADDHCQRYQGITRANTIEAQQAIEATRGEVLISENNICDARFSKSCGGAFEEFQNCWDDVEYSYLKKQRDCKEITELPDLSIEKESENWIRTSPEAFCNTNDKKILGQVLNNYDQETTDFFRWKVEYSQKELSELIKKRSGVDYGNIVDLRPIQRGTSSRLVQLEIVGTKQTKIIGKELEIRRTLSESHLYSSAFVIDKEYDANSEDKELPTKFILTGAGWGHGVGLCQIGAAVMGEKGYDYEAILKHYYIGAELEKLY